MNRQIQDPQNIPNKNDAPRVAFIAAQWHADIVEKCREGFAGEFARLGYGADSTDFYKVPGSYDIPLLAKKLAGSGKYEAVVAAGFIVDGGIYRHEFVSHAVIDGLMRVQLETDVPVISAVLTPHRFQEEETQIRFFTEHFLIKGQEAARACAEIIANLRSLAA
ncbi:MAG: 6,7-dimethyl-8-ribityllumazine synthase [Rhodospirillales bacterium]